MSDGGGSNNESSGIIIAKRRISDFLEETIVCSNSFTDVVAKRNFVKGIVAALVESDLFMNDEDSKELVNHLETMVYPDIRDYVYEDGGEAFFIDHEEVNDVINVLNDFLVDYELAVVRTGFGYQFDFVYSKNGIASVIFSAKTGEIFDGLRLPNDGDPPITPMISIGQRYIDVMHVGGTAVVQAYLGGKPLMR